MCPPTSKTRFRLVTGSAALLLVEVEREAYTVVNPTLADLAQSPYSPGLGQGVCDLGQTCGVGDRSKAVSLLGEGDASLARRQRTRGGSRSPGRGREDAR